jgi:putative nucleotidyltransferase with HDIG domain
VSLLRVFLIASAGILVTGAIILGWILTGSLRKQALDDAARSLTQYADGVLRSQLVQNDRLHVSPRLPQQLEAQLQGQPDLITVKVWKPDGVLAWTNRAPQRIGKRFSFEGGLGETIADKRAHASIGTLDGGEDAAERAAEPGRVLEVYAPLLSTDGLHVIGAYEIYADPSRTESFISSEKRLIWIAVLGVFGALYGALALFVRRASKTLQKQATALRSRSKELMESYRRLEESALEAIESLNATVDAKDPYTAGHSARVQRVAVAIAEEMQLARESLDAVRFGGLFHDIGKIAVPDCILVKPGVLDEREYATIKRHPVDGAAIVEHFGRLREAVPLIRHHHERWDGKGYPDSLAGADIPLEACIVGLADAWDAMTTERPYRGAMTVDQAAAEVRRCRGTQFAPAVVDAFFAALRRRPAVFEPDQTYDVAATA